nr:lipocalin family protein [uncultured Flavobacterium sp.]
MKKIFSILFIALFFVACQQKINSADVSKLNGYWEIEKVTFEKEKDKDYGINESYDYFKIDKNNKGIRKKVMPQLDGTFLVNDAYENVTVRFKDDKVYIDYSTPFTKWSEELITLKDDELVLLNADKKEYHYKKTGPINLLDDGKKVK